MTDDLEPKDQCERCGIAGKPLNRSEEYTGYCSDCVEVLEALKEQSKKVAELARFLGSNCNDSAKILAKMKLASEEVDEHGLDVIASQNATQVNKGFSLEIPFNKSTPPPKDANEFRDLLLQICQEHGLEGERVGIGDHDDSCISVNQCKVFLNNPEDHQDWVDAIRAITKLMIEDLARFGPRLSDSASVPVRNVYIRGVMDGEYDERFPVLKRDGAKQGLISVISASRKDKDSETDRSIPLLTAGVLLMDLESRVRHLTKFVQLLGSNNENRSVYKKPMDGVMNIGAIKKWLREFDGPLEGNTKERMLNSLAEYFAEVMMKSGFKPDDLDEEDEGDGEDK